MPLTHTLAFEIGTEEIPAFDLHNATLQLPGLTQKIFEAAAIPFGSIKVYTTPRRLIIMVEDVADTTEAKTEVFRGPSVKIAFDAEGNPTKAACGFARGKGVDVSSLVVRAEGKTEYVFCERQIAAKSVVELLGAGGVLKSIIEGITWPKSCHWGITRELFSRPVRWIVALLDDQIIEVEFAGVKSSNKTHGHRTLSRGPHTVAHANELLDVVSGAFVLPSEELRERSIREGVARVEAETGYEVRIPEKTLLEVVNLCEYPTILVGTFDEEFLKVPEEIIVDAMLMHQRYFPVYDNEGKLVNKFIVIANGNPEYADIIIGGNERVVRPRLSDAKFFYEEDLKRPLEAYVERLDELVFQETLGTVRAKVGRVVTLTEHLANAASFNEQEKADALRAAELCKADLVTNAVIEFTSVQGIMGSYYAKAAGEREVVAQAIADHYKPRFSGDELPADKVGRAVAFADKLDSVCALFAVGQAPTGSSDPFALRRSALGIIAMLEAGFEVSLSGAIDASLETLVAQGINFDREARRAELLEFFITRTKVLLRDRGFAQDAIDAVLAVGVAEPVVIVSRVEVLSSAREANAELFDNLATAYARANNLRDTSAGTEVDEALLVDVEQDLVCAVAAASNDLEKALSVDDYEEALVILGALRAPIDTFFESIMIMDEDLAKRANRLRILNAFVEVFAQVADFGKMAKK